MKNKLAAIYNVFDCEELLQESIDRIRREVDLVIVVYQKISNFGINHKIDIEKYLKNLNGIDILSLYEPNFNLPPWKNEISKRVSGCRIALLNECTHFLHIDCDEMYNSDSFTKAKNLIYEKNCDSSACSIIDYYKFSNLQVIESSKSFVPFIHKLTKDVTTFGLELKYPVSVDNTRKTNPTNSFFMFNQNELVMNHYSWIRNDIRIKLLNSTARHSYDFFIEILINEFDNFQINDSLVKLETGLLVPLSLLQKINIPYTYINVKTKLLGDK